MEDNEEAPDDVKQATPVEEEIKKGEIDEHSNKPIAPIETPRRRHYCEKDRPKNVKKTLNNKEECCRAKLEKSARAPKTQTVLVYDKECTLPKIKCIPRHCLSKEQWIDILATPKRRCPPPCFHKQVTRKVRPVSTRVAELARPPKSRLFNTLQDRAGTLPIELVDNLVQTLEGEACLTPEQAERMFRDKDIRARKKCRKRKSKLSCKESKLSKREDQAIVQNPSLFDKEAVSCQYMMAENFVKSILEWKTPIPREEFKDIAEVILKRLGYVLEYNPVNDEDRKSQQMRFLADIVASWISGVLFDVAEAQKTQLEEECEKKRQEIEEETEEDSDDESEEGPDEDDEDDEDDDDDEGKDTKKKKEKEKKPPKKKKDDKDKKGRGDGKDDEDDDDDKKGGTPGRPKEGKGDAADVGDAEETLKEDENVQKDEEPTRDDVEEPQETEETLQKEDGTEELELTTQEENTMENEAGGNEAESKQEAEEKEKAEEDEKIKEMEDKSRDTTEDESKVATLDKQPIPEEIDDEKTEVDVQDNDEAEKDNQGEDIGAISPPDELQIGQAEEDNILEEPEEATQGKLEESPTIEHEAVAEVDISEFPNEAKTPETDENIPAEETSVAEEITKPETDERAAGDKKDEETLQFEQTDTPKVPEIPKATEEEVIPSDAEDLDKEIYRDKSSLEETEKILDAATGLKSSQPRRKPSKIPSSVRIKKFQTDTPFVTFDKIFHTIYNAIEATRENSGDDAITNRIHRAVYEKCSNVVQEEKSEPLGALTKDLLEVLSGKIALWLRDVLDESELAFMNKFPATVESCDVREWTKWMAYVSETANTWSTWIQQTIRQAEAMRSGKVTRGDWLDWTKSVGEDALLWRRFYLESLHQAHQNLTIIRDRRVVKTGTRILPDEDYEKEMKTTNLEIN